MINFLKKLFKKKEKIGLTLDRLEDWFDQKTKDSYDNITNNIKELKQKISDEIIITKENVQSLRNAELHNDKVTTKELQFMEGNRDSYTKRVLLFIDSIKFDENTKELTEKVHQEVNNLSKSTAKAYHILTNFFSDESYKVAQNIKKIDDHFKQLKELLAHKEIKDIEQIKEKIDSIKENITREKQLKDHIDETEKDIKELQKEKRNILSEISNKEQSQDFKEYHRLNVEEYKVKEQIDEIKDEILHYLSSLEHALRKYINLYPNEEGFINKYIESPLKALVDDYELKIISILEKLEEDIHTKKIELKDKKKIKTLQTINKINKAQLASFLTEYNQFMVELRSLNERLKQHTIIEEIENIKIKMKKKKSEIENLSTKLSELNNKLSQIDIKQIKNNIKHKIETLLDIELDID